MDVGALLGGLVDAPRDPLEQADRDYAPLAKMLGLIAHKTVTLPQRMFDASENLRTQGGYDAAPAVELMGKLYGLNSPFSPTNAMGALRTRGKPGRADFEKLLVKQRTRSAMDATSSGQPDAR